MFRTIFKTVVAFGVGSLILLFVGFAITCAEPAAALAPLAAIAGAVLVGASFLRGNENKLDEIVTLVLRMASVGAFLQSGWYWLWSVEDISAWALGIGFATMFIGGLVGVLLNVDLFREVFGGAAKRDS